MPEPTNYQVRTHVINDNVKAYLQYASQWKCDQAFAFHHTESKREHWHWYLIGCTLSYDALRDNVKKWCEGNKDFSIRTKAGRGVFEKPIVAGEAYQYGCTNKLLEPFYKWNINEADEAQWRTAAEAFYKPVPVDNKERITVEITKIKPDMVWAKFYERMLHTPASVGWSRSQFRKWIVADYLSNCKPPPRTADLNRYSYALFMLRDKRSPDGYTFSPDEIPDLEI